MLKIVIKTDADFTPPGKRNARIVTLDRGIRRLRWYVSGRIFRQLPISRTNIDLTHVWLTA